MDERRPVRFRELLRALVDGGVRFIVVGGVAAVLAGTNTFGQADWTTALTAAQALSNGACSLSDGSVAGDWRLPSVNELQSLIDHEYYIPALSNAAGTAQWSEGDVFAGVRSNIYWSSTSNALYPSEPWAVTLGFGNVGSLGKTDTSYVWPVRGGQ